ncbi:MAG: hypothetical protein WB760_06995 [Xanthobacteraceae bacterium]
MIELEKDSPIAYPAPQRVATAQNLYVALIGVLTHIRESLVDLVALAGGEAAKLTPGPITDQ